MRTCPETTTFQGFFFVRKRFRRQGGRSAEREEAKWGRGDTNPAWKPERARERCGRGRGDAPEQDPAELICSKPHGHRLSDCSVRWADFVKNMCNMIKKACAIRPLRV